MYGLSSARITIPKAAGGEIVRKELLNIILNNRRKLFYIHAGAGYGKTTLLSQAAKASDKTVWATLDGESDIFSFTNTLTEAMRITLPEFSFTASEYLPLENKPDFIIILANALINSIEKLPYNFMIILEDLHSIQTSSIFTLVSCLVKYQPENTRICLSSREAPWQELIPLRLRGALCELTQKDLAFTKDEVAQILGFVDDELYNASEGWPIAIGSFKMLLENGVSPAELKARGREALYAYLFCECISRLAPEMVDFLKVSASFEELDASMLDTVLDIKNSKLLLDSLVTRNMFTVRTGGGNYRYHSLFKEYLVQETEAAKKNDLLDKAIIYYLNKGDFSAAAGYAILSRNQKMLQQIILESYKSLIRQSKFNELRKWFQALEENTSLLDGRVLAAKGALFSCTGNFTEAKACLDAAIPKLSGKDKECYIDAMVHQARVARNFVSFEESNRILEELAKELDDLSSEISYTVMIEKLYNLCWDSKINEAGKTAADMIETCAKAGNLRVKAWYERYLTAIHFFAGRMKDCVRCYEKSLELPENEHQYLDMHCVGIYAAKAYQMLGQQSRSVALISDELQKLRNSGRYEELWAGFLLAAEIHYQNSFINRMNGGSETFETTIRYFTLADEYAPLCRKTDFQMHWAKMQRLTFSLMFTSEPKEPIINEIFIRHKNSGSYLKTIILGRLFGYFAAVSDFPNAVLCARECIEVGEKSNIMLIPTLAYGILARAAIAMKDLPQASILVKRYLQLCAEKGTYEYFKMRSAYDPILEFAASNEIEPAFTKQMMEFAGFKRKKVLISTLGGLSISAGKNSQEPIKMRTRKERELFVFLLNAGSSGATKDQIYEALWFDSESDNIKKLIGVNLAHIKKDLAALDIRDPIINHANHYSICRDEIECDTDLLDDAIAAFTANKCRETAQKILSLYKGEYLAGYEALWVISRRIYYSEACKKALDYCSLK